MPEVAAAPMNTEILVVDPHHPQPEPIAHAAAVLRAGGVVAFPTETVYGLGADALSESAVSRIFAAKGRPANNPLIVHIADLDAARRLASHWPAAAEKLASAFWPGPLTLVVPKADSIPAIVTAGGPTVALRIPDHPVARALLLAAQRPLAAPSANLSTRVSAVRAEHVAAGLSCRIELILDGGPTACGLESTVVDVSGPRPRLLRHGVIGAAELTAALGEDIEIVERHAGDHDVGIASPGMHRKHYSPAVPLDIVDGSGAADLAELLRTKSKIGWVSCGGDASPTAPREGVVQICLADEPEAYARRLYDTLHTLEAAGVEHIVVERPPRAPGWEAIHDRLTRAAAK